jgi:hypothetical protein
MSLTEDNIDDLKDIFYEEFELAFRKLLKLYLNFVLQYNIRKMKKKRVGLEFSQKDKVVGGWLILRRISERQDGMVWAGLIWLRIVKRRALVNTIINLRVP